MEHTLAPLKPEELRRTFSASELGCRYVSEIEPIDILPGQERALGALEFGMDMRHVGYNCYVLGAPGTGRKSATLKLLNERAAHQRAPDDWVYVFNFQSSHHPIALKLPAKTANDFKDAMEELIDDLRVAIPEVFKSDEYRDKRRGLDSDLAEQQDDAFEALAKKAKAQNVAIIRTPLGFALTPAVDGQVLKPEEFNALPESERRETEEKIAVLQEELTQVLEHMPKLHRQHRDKVRELNAQMTGVVVDASINVITRRFETIETIQERLVNVRKDLIENTELFLADEVSEDVPFPQNPSLKRNDPRFNRYRVNVMVSNGRDGGTLGAPVIFEEHPTLQRLLGRIEHFAQFGALITDFTMIRPGALHAANGGFLVLEARKILSEPFAWEALKRTIKGEAIKIVSAADEIGLTSTISLEPEPIPLDIKIVLVGDRLIYYLLSAYDPDFRDLFKVEADFNELLDRTGKNTTLYLQLISSILEKEKLLDFKAEAAARVLEEAVRLAEDTEKLTLNVERLADLLREAAYQAEKSNRRKVTKGDVETAIAEQIHRADRIRERTFEAIRRETLLIDVTGKSVGQINGLSVLDLGNFRFGKPTRITARTRTGKGKFVDIERETDLGGSIHSKGVLILSSYLSATFALDVPLSLWASIVFEQSYGGVEGDSASSAELYALLSALSDIPIKQSFAVTGSVNQMGQVQAIGGVNEKIEGFFDICQSRGLNGTQGVLIPQSNVKHLMLRPDIVEACAAGKFKVFPVSHIEEGIELLTGVSAGVRDENGFFPQNSLYRKVEEKLHAYANARRVFLKSKKKLPVNDELDQ